MIWRSVFIACVDRYRLNDDFCCVMGVENEWTDCRYITASSTNLKLSAHNKFAKKTALVVQNRSVIIKFGLFFLMSLFICFFYRLIFVPFVTVAHFYTPPPFILPLW